MTRSKSADEAKDRLDLHHVVRSAARLHFELFLRKVFEELCPGDEFCFSWHLDAIAHALERTSDGEVRRQIVTMPPRHLKSIAISIAWVAWQLGKDPSMRFICVSYNNELAAKLARDCRQVMLSDWYRELFPNTLLRRASEMEIETTAGGGRFATSVGGTLTGRGADAIIIDDPMKADDAMSSAVRRQVIDWTSSTLFTRLNDKRSGVVVLVMQRLHEEDLAGHFLEVGGWEHLNLPAIAEEEQIIPLIGGRAHLRSCGDVLHPEREPLETLMELKRELGSNAFSAQYQQAPIPSGGALVKREWFQRYRNAPNKGPGDLVVQSWDTASKDGALNDYSVCVTALVSKDTVYILGVFRKQMNFPELLRQVELQAERFSPDVLLVEDAASGQQLIQMLHNEALSGVPRPLACKPNSDKITRMSACTPLIEAGGLVLPHEAPWLPDLEREVLAFPNGKYDDQADALSQLLTWRREQPKIVRAMALLDSDEDFPDIY